MKSIRAFLAITLDLPAVRALGDLQKRLRDRCRATGLDVAFVAPPNLHLTVRFLGEVAEPLPRAIRPHCALALREQGDFSLRVRGLGLFPDAPGTPRVIWAGLEDPDARLRQLFERVGERLGESGFAPEARPFRPHVTVARVRDGERADLEAAIAPDRELLFGTTRVRELVCYRSDLRPRGAEYHALWRLPFGEIPREIPDAPRAADDQPFFTEPPLVDDDEDSEENPET